MEESKIDIKIHPEIEKLIPPLSSDEFELLKESILKDGIRDALVVWPHNGELILLDGHHRLKIAKEHGLNFHIIKRTFYTIEEAKAWVLQNQLGRRNLTDEQQAYFLGKLYEMKKKAPGGFKDRNLTAGKNSPRSGRHVTAEALASDFGIDESSIRKNYVDFAKAVDVIKEIKPTVAEKILKGEVKDALTTLPKVIKNEKPEVMKKALEVIDEGEKRVRIAIAKVKSTEIAAQDPPPPNGKFKVIYIDPPWPVETIDLEKWESPIEEKYPTMSLDEIRKLPIKTLADDDCALFLWATHRFLYEALKMVEEWGFKHFCTITWDKQRGWTQFGFQKRTEFLIYAYRGRMVVNQYGEAIPTLISELAREHSKKPNIIRDLITKKTPPPRLEMFARGKAPDGWVFWGNEAK